MLRYFTRSRLANNQGKPNGLNNLKMDLFTQQILIEHLLWTVIVLDSSDAGMNKTEQVLTLMELTFLWEMNDSKWENKPIITTCSKGFNGNELGVLLREHFLWTVVREVWSKGLTVTYKLRQIRRCQISKGIEGEHLGILKEQEDSQHGWERGREVEKWFKVTRS